MTMSYQRPRTGPYRRPNRTTRNPRMNVHMDAFACACGQHDDHGECRRSCSCR